MALRSPATRNDLENRFWRDHESQTAVVELSAGQRGEPTQSRSSLSKSGNRGGKLRPPEALD